MSDTFATEQHQVDAPSKAEKQSITAGEMLQQLIADGYIVTPADSYVQPTMPTAYGTVPSITVGYSIPTALPPEAG
ncbi:MAG: hypothetical protein OXC63_11920 [Aestuariivita sp.]|nr:hypothetical protein [Aestuariivita sp.]MCY4348050.1 hypothetical protein [Aestuariivita sp.]